MPNILAHDPIRALPIYQDGFRRGTDLGLPVALDALTSERVRLGQLAARTYSPHSLDQHRIAYADARLGAVAKVLAEIFRAGLPLP